MSSIKRQCNRIIAHLEKHGSITQNEAKDNYGISRLGARIYDLKAMGYEFTKITETGLNRFGEKTHWARYYLK